MRRPLTKHCRLLFVCALVGAVSVLGTWVGTDAASAQPIPLPGSDGGGGGKNIVIVNNQRDGATQIRGHVQVNRIPGPVAAPSNIAMATSSCSQCQTLAVALQIDVMSTNTRLAAPENAAVAVNAGCTGCVTVAWAIQYVVTVQDPTKELPPNLQRFIAALNQELTAASTSATSICAAVPRINEVILRFPEFAQNLYAQQLNTPDLIPCLP